MLIPNDVFNLHIPVRAFLTVCVCFNLVSLISRTKGIVRSCEALWQRHTGTESGVSKSPSMNRHLFSGFRLYHQFVAKVVEHNVRQFPSIVMKHDKDLRLAIRPFTRRQTPMQEVRADYPVGPIRCVGDFYAYRKGSQNLKMSEIP